MKKIISLILALLFITPTSVLADGIIIPPPNQNITQAQQKALIVHQEGKEDLIIFLEFRGNAKEFAWFLPVPEKPEIKRGDDEVFTKLGELTRPKKNLLEKIKGERRISRPIPFLGKGVVEAPEEEKVEVIETKRVGILDVTVLTATKAADLEEWLKENGYQVPGGKVFPEVELKKPLPTEPIMRSQEETKTMPPPDIRLWPRPTPVPAINKARQIFQEYLDDGWYFVAAKIAAEFLEEFPKVTPRPEIPVPLGEEREEALRVEKETERMIYPPPPLRYFAQAHITPLHLTFKTDKIVYPMKITSLNNDSPSVLLYVVSNHKKKVSNYTFNLPRVSKEREENLIFKTKYATPIKGRKLQEWLPNLKDGYLTKLYASHISSSQMKEDLRFEDVGDDLEVGTGKMRARDYLLVPLYLGIYGPIRVLEFLFGQTYPYHPAFSRTWPIFLFVLLSILGSFGLFWVLIFYFLLSRTRGRLKRAFLYLLQFPGVWLLVNLLSLIFILPCFVILLLLKVDDRVLFVDLLLKNNLGAVFFTFLFYNLQGKIHILWKKNSS